GGGTGGGATRVGVRFIEATDAQAGIPSRQTKSSDRSSPRATSWLNSDVEIGPTLLPSRT
ncbi:MAG: hypothetical protein ABI614_10975, partial [Planctomycetota bacterium]